VTLVATMLLPQPGRDVVAQELEQGAAEPVPERARVSAARATVPQT
jgi:hypothetical protein